LLNVQLSQGKLASDLRWGARFNLPSSADISESTSDKNIKKPVHICQSFHKRLHGCFYDSQCICQLWLFKQQ